MVSEMSTSRVHVNELRQLEAEAWTELLRRTPPLREIVVRHVGVEPVSPALTRYLLHFDGYSDPVPFIGKKTTAREASFYRDIAAQIPRLLPPCRLSHVAQDWSWLVLDEIPDDRPPARWTDDDVEKVIATLASFHGTFWQQSETLAAYPWLSSYLGQHGADVPPQRMLDAWLYWDSTAGRGQALSSHALHSAGPLAPVFVRAAAGLAILRRLGGWPGVISGRHLVAIAELLDDPVPLLQPLRELPVTLLHGNLALHHWHLTLFDSRLLFDWGNVVVGPPILDLVDFLESVERQRAQQNQGGNGRAWPVSEETMVDSYLLRMHVGLAHFDARAMRQALPAAFCLHVLTTWLPRFAEWFEPFVQSPLTWRALLEMDDAELHHAGYGRLAGLHHYLANLFVRFWHDAKLL